MNSVYLLLCANKKWQMQLYVLMYVSFIRKHQQTEQDFFLELRNWPFDEDKSGLSLGIFQLTSRKFILKWQSYFRG